MTRAILAAAIGLALMAPGSARAAPSAPERIVLPDNVVPERYAIVVTPEAASLTFAGSVKIAVEMRKATDRIVLNMADLKLERVRLSGREEAPSIELDKDQQTASFVFAKPVEPGRYTLSIDYRGVIYEQASGLFAFDYDTPKGKRRALFTQFQNSDARRFVPSWDEPGIKSVFALTVIVPEHEMAVSNMPVAETTPQPDGRKAIRFADSPKMSSYLLFLALGDFERISTKAGEVDIGLVARRGAAEQGRFALEAAVKLLDYYNVYFGTPYPLPKLDLVSAPGNTQTFAAMENWGAIFFLDQYLLLDPKLSTDKDKQNVFIMVAHEVAHQWFGNLVTMEWWDDLWLNEGFASWMENKATDHFHPEWKIWLRAAARQQRAMREDASTGTHPIVTPIPDVFAAASAFDSITYDKGKAVVRMIEAYADEEAFRAGVRDYLKAHAYGNATSADLWAAIDRVSPRPVAEIARDFTEQEGVPLVRAAATPAGIELSQGRFALDEASRKELRWETPVIVAPAEGGAVWRGVVSSASPAVVSSLPAEGAVVNKSQTGYFRVAYDRALWPPLAAQFAALQPEDQLGLIFDSLALGEAGYVPMSDFLDLANHARANADSLVLNVLADKLDGIDYYYEGLPGRGAYRAFVRRKLAPALERFGWDARPGEADNDAVARAMILSTLGCMDDQGVIAEARKRFSAYLDDPSSLEGSTRQTVLGIVACNADQESWEQLHELARKATNPTDKTRLYSLLGASRDTALADKAMALALGDEAPTTIRPNLINEVGHVFPERAFDFATQHREKIEPLLETMSRYSYFADIASGSRELGTIDKLSSYADAHIPATGRSEVLKAIAAIRIRAKVIAERLPDIDRWLAANGGRS